MANPHSLHLPVLRQTNNNTCLFCDAEHDIHRLSIECKVQVFVLCNIFFPETVRSCNHHIDERGFIIPHLLGGLNCVMRHIIVPPVYMQAFLQEMRTNSLMSRKRFMDITDFTDEECNIFTSLTKLQFEELFAYCGPVDGTTITRKDLLMFLCKLRQGLSDEFLTVMFQYHDRPSVSKVIKTVRLSLMARFVPENIGLGAITRHDYIRLHVTEFANYLYNDEPDNPVAISYIDGTYTYCHKSTNFRSLRQTYCRHKNRHLVKPALVVAPDGYILDIQGPYFSDAQNNDAAMIINELDNDEELVNWYQEGDIVIVDRGYRDAVDDFEEMGLIVKMPPLLQAGQRQHTRRDANAARIVTKTRWVAEARNGHLKTIFKYLNLVQQIHVLENIGDFYKIGGALINA